MAVDRREGEAINPRRLGVRIAASVARGDVKQDGEEIGGGAESAPRPTIDKLQVGAAASALVSAATGDIAVVYSRSAEHEHYSLADIKWLILPVVLRGQFYVAQAARKDTGFRAPVAVATWAFVSDEVDRRLSADLTHRIRLRPDEWKCGEIAWIVDLVGAPAGIANAVQWLKAGPLKEREAKVVVRDAKGGARVTTLDALGIDEGAKEPAQ
jgi:cytolysin-activating lysine-acyltransferase